MFSEAHNSSLSHLTPCLLGTKQELHHLLGALHQQDIPKTRYFRRLQTPLSSYGRLSLSNPDQMGARPLSGLTSSALAMSGGSALVVSSAVCGRLMVQKRWRGVGLVGGGAGGVRKRAKSLQSTRSGRKLVRLLGTLVR